MKIRCHNCMHVWEYTGNSTKYAVCPQCHYNCMIKKDQVSEFDNSLTYIPKTHLHHSRTNKAKSSKINLYDSRISDNLADNSLSQDLETSEIKDLRNKIYELENKIIALESLIANNLSMAGKDKKEISHIEYSRLQGKEITCPHCNHSWTYRGSMQMARCSNCNSRIYLKS